MLDRRAFAGAMAGLCALPWLSACGRSGASASTAEGGGGADALRVCVPKPQAIDPFALADDAGMCVAAQLFDPLVRLDYETGAFAGLATSSFEMNEDATLFTFHLLPGATFHSGEPVTAQAFKRAWERLVDPRSGARELFEGAPAARHLALVEGYEALRHAGSSGLAGVTCPDEYTLQVKLSRPYVDFPAVAAHPSLAPVPQSALEDAEGFAKRPVGNGAFALEDAWDGGDALALVRYDAYAGPGGVARAARVELAFNDDAAGAYKQFEAGDLDVCTPPVEQLEDARKNFASAPEGAQAGEGSSSAAPPALVEQTGQALYYLVCNTRAAPLDVVDVRRALSLAIDREGLCERVLRESHVPAEGPVPPSLAQGAATAWGACAYDADQAAALLGATHPADEDGARDLGVSLTCVSDGIDAKVAEAVAEDLGAVGIEVSIETLRPEDAAERARTGAFELLCARWEPDYPVLDNIAYPLLHSGTRGDTNLSGYADEEADKALDDARSTVDASARAGLALDALKRAGEACPIIPIAFDTHVLAVQGRVDGLRLDPDGRVALSAAGLA